MSHQHHDQHDIDLMLTRDYWDERYGGDRVWSGNPNRRLVEQVADLTPGTALDVGCGEGADAVWLAQQGWTTSAVDVSQVALDKTAQHAGEAGVAVRTMRHDLLSGDPLPGGSYDLVTAHFIHVGTERFEAVWRLIGEAVGAGGRLLVVGHHPEDVASGVRRPHGEGLLFTAAEVLAVFGAGWEVEVADEPTRTQVHEGQEMQVRDTVVRLRRTA